jgi:hypothetical protein
MMMLPIVFSVTAALEETHGAKVKEVYDCNIAWGGIWMLYYELLH